MNLWLLGTMTQNWTFRVLVPPRMLGQTYSRLVLKSSGSNFGSEPNNGTATQGCRPRVRPVLRVVSNQYNLTFDKILLVYGAETFGLERPRE